MRGVIAAAAVLCLLAAQPASAAWTTGGQGAAGAKAATVAAPGVPAYDVWWSDKDNGEGNFKGSFRVSSPPCTVTGGPPLRVKVQSVAGTWRSVQVSEQVCS
ncbi:hypothetical protein [Lentzea jiangxiensis]|uniref:Uncharacterized protein n=1 Tax=Lentzea jiangxiensis TaxID=641025 RepID=A0A1H0H8X4_9PSEU|nr:hypothetical protein [Lentzea jiangxiensis]SDO15361.1 hypothetical protein SAMN05421507_1011562 [Lentzea jiangxiensis]